MNPGNHAFAAATVDIPASRSSLTSRSCSVPNARSTRPFACGLFAQMIVDVQLRQRTAKLRDALAAHRILAVHPKDAVLVAVKGNRLAMPLEVIARRPEVIECRLQRQRNAATINRLVASSTNASRVHISPRASNQACSEPSICTSSPRQSRRRRG
jgi:hypothetical protein